MDKSIKFEKDFWCANKSCPGHLWMAGVRHFHFILNHNNYAALVKGDIESGKTYIRIVRVPDLGKVNFCQELPAIDLSTPTDLTNYQVSKFLKKHAKELLVC